MSEKVVSLDEERAKRTPHMTGRARCLGCQHVWAAVAPLGSVWFECPACHRERGHFVNHIEIEDTEHWHCACGNDLFFVAREPSTGGSIAYCPNCGEPQMVNQPSA